MSTPSSPSCSSGTAWCSVARLELKIQDELDRLKAEPITEAELQQAKNQWARDYVFGRESNKDKASHLGHAAVIHDDITTADGEFDLLMNITAADVQRVAQTYFRPENRLVLTIMPRGSNGGASR